MEETERQKDNRVSCESSFFVYLSRPEIGLQKKK